MSSDSKPARGNIPAVILGTVAVYVGAIILLIAACEEFAGGLPGLPRFWYVNRSIWIGLGLVLIPVGIAIQGRFQAPQPVWRATRLGRRFHQVRVYSREGCHLCDDAVELLEGDGYRIYLPPVEIVDIAGNSELESQFGLSIPVVEFDGRVRFKGRINEVLLRRLIEGTDPL